MNVQVGLVAAQEHAQCIQLTMSVLVEKHLLNHPFPMTKIVVAYIKLEPSAVNLFTFLIVILG
jgi:hypothetical protein